MGTKVKMIRNLVIQFLGFLTSVFPLLQVLITTIKKGYVHTKERKKQPLILKDKRWNGNEGFVRVSPEVKIHYVEKGDRNKPLMLFLHGFPEFWFSWRFQLEHFSKDYHCVAIDMRGYNFSDKPEGIRQYGLDQLCSDVKAVIEGMDKKECILVGHDWGGSVGYGFCATYPEMVSCYIVCNLPHPQSIRHEQANSWKQRLMSWYMLFFQCPTIPEFFFTHDDYALLDEIVKEQKASNHEEIVEAYKYAFKDTKSVTSTINYYRCAIQYPESYSEIIAKKVDTPVLSIFGTEDKAMSIEAARGTRRYVENLTEDYVDAVGHWVQIEDPQRVNKSIEDFLLFHGPKKNGSKFSLKKLKNRRASQENLDNAGLENGSKKIQDTTILENLGIPAEVYPYLGGLMLLMGVVVNEVLYPNPNNFAHSLRPRV